MSLLSRLAFLFICLTLRPAAGHATVTLYTDWNCAGYSLSREGGRISNLKEFTYRYWGTVTKYYGKGGEYDIDVPGWVYCSFNDAVYSVKITDDEAVELFKHDNFRGDSEYMSGNGCYNLGSLQGEATSVIITQ